MKLTVWAIPAELTDARCRKNAGVAERPGGCRTAAHVEQVHELAVGAGASSLCASRACRLAARATVVHSLAVSATRIIAASSG